MMLRLSAYRQFDIGSLFAGIGGFDLAFRDAGFAVRWQVEQDPFCQLVLKKNFPLATRYGDIRDCVKLSPVDVITAGFPCQPFSVAGDMRGGNDERYLVPEMLRVIKECMPYVILLENVPNFATLDDGGYFRQLLRAFAQMGYDAEWGHLSAEGVGAPHVRERWFCIAYRAVSYTHSLRRRTGQSQKSIRGQSHSHTLRHPELSTQSRLTSTLSNQSGLHAPHNGERRGLRKLRVGGNTHGLSPRMDSNLMTHQFPAGSLEPQREGELPRLVPERAEHDRKRLKALGNAIVPQVIHPLVSAIHEWLVRRDFQEQQVLKAG